MNSKANLADNALLIGVVAIVIFVAFGIFAAVVHTILFAIKLVILIAALAVGWRVVTAISGGGERRRELKR
jgi:hypothetical protein